MGDMAGESMIVSGTLTAIHSHPQFFYSAVTLQPKYVQSNIRGWVC